MTEELVFSHLIVTDIYDEYSVKWVGKILDTKPKLVNGKPVFIVIGSRGRIELNTTDMSRVEKCAKILTQPKGREAVTMDTSRIYIQEEDDKETLMGVLVHDRIKKFAPMFDPPECLNR